MAEAQEVCRSFRNNGRCRFGDECRFEHSTGEPIPPPAERKERGECFNFRESGECAHGDRCRFTHGPDDTRHTGDISDEVCRNYLKGRCKFGEECRRKHEGTPEAASESAPRRRQRKSSKAEEGEGRERRARKPRAPRGPGPCFDFRDGNCERGDECRFSHDPDAEVRERKPRQPREVKKIDEVCNNFKEGKFRLGDRCRRIHEE